MVCVCVCSTGSADSPEEAAGPAPPPPEHISHIDDTNPVPEEQVRRMYVRTAVIAESEKENRNGLVPVFWYFITTAKALFIWERIPFLII